jgi:hypothetical protein
MQKKIKSPAKKKAGKPSITKAKAAGKKAVKKAAKEVKAPVVKATKKSVMVKSKSRAEKKSAKVAKTPVVPHIITHGKDLHFIPEHKKNVAEIVHNKIKEEKVFHNKEEVALHQENQKAKTAMVAGMGRKRVFNSQGRR